MERIRKLPEPLKLIDKAKLKNLKIIEEKKPIIKEIPTINLFPHSKNSNNL